MAGENGSNRARATRDAPGIEVHAEGGRRLVGTALVTVQHDAVIGGKLRHRGDKVRIRAYSDGSWSYDFVYVRAKVATP